MEARPMNKEFPIFIPEHMLSLVLSGEKTQARFPIKGSPVHVVPYIDGRTKLPTHKFGLCLHSDRVANKDVKCPYGKAGDTLWLKERWNSTFKGELMPGEYFKDHKACVADNDGFQDAWRDGVVYAHDLDGPEREHPKHGKARWKSAYHMPRWAARTPLEVVNVKVERLWEISAEDAKKEGFSCPNHREPHECNCVCNFFEEQWERQYGQESWDANVWVWAVEFQLK